MLVGPLTQSGDTSRPKSSQRLQKEECSRSCALFRFNRYRFIRGGIEDSHQHIVTEIMCVSHCLMALFSRIFLLCPRSTTLVASWSTNSLQFLPYLDSSSGIPVTIKTPDSEMYRRLRISKGPINQEALVAIRWD